MDDVAKDLAQRNGNRLFYDVCCKDEDQISFQVVAKTKSGQLVEVNLNVRIADKPEVTVTSTEIREPSTW